MGLCQKNCHVKPGKLPFNVGNCSLFNYQFLTTKRTGLPWLLRGLRVHSVHLDILCASKCFLSHGDLGGMTRPLPLYSNHASHSCIFLQIPVDLCSLGYSKHLSAYFTLCLQVSGATQLWEMARSFKCQEQDLHLGVVSSAVSAEVVASFSDQIWIG